MQQTKVAISVTASFGEKPDYSGFDREKWIPRTHTVFYDLAVKHKHAKT